MIETRHRHGLAGAAVLVVWLLFWPAWTACGLDFPGPEPGPAKGRVDQGRLVLENEVLAAGWTISAGRMTPGYVTNKLATDTLQLHGSECFQVVLADSPLSSVRIVKASELTLMGEPELTALEPDGRSTRLADKSGGRRIVVRMTLAGGNLEIRWEAVLRDGSNYVRQTVRVSANNEAFEVREVVLLDMGAPNAEVVGTVDGSPVVAGDMFFACEHPIAKSEILTPDVGDGKATRFRCSYPSNALLMPGRPLEYSSVVGVVPRGQLRRGFLYYLERQRAQPYRPLLHYNNGSEIGCEYWRRKLHGKPEEAELFRRTQEKVWLENIGAFGRELVEKRGVVMDSFAHDFEWDDETLVWQFHGGYPNGFTPARQAAQACGARLGVWFSPWGGYPGKGIRIEQGRKQGFETRPLGLSLAGKRYYARFRTACVNMIRNYGVNYFKFDGFGAGNNKPGPAPYASDVEALVRLIGELREVDSDVFVNPSTGSWPSPFWLRHADSIWRQGSDTGVSGKGPDRQKWITYRDGEIFHGILGKSPLYPINSLMIHGVFINRLPLFGNPYDPASPRPTYETAEIIAEIRSFFGTGTNLQELYVDPSLMTAQTWDALAESAKWSRGNSDVLVDTHWIGGDPAKDEVYGWASWSNRKGILVLRNPEDRPATIRLDIEEAFELPNGAPRKYTLKSPWKEDAGNPAVELSAGTGHTFTLAPFEVLVWDAMPTRP